MQGFVDYDFITKKNLIEIKNKYYNNHFLIYFSIIKYLKKNLYANIIKKN